MRAESAGSVISSASERLKMAAPKSNSAGDPPYIVDPRARIGHVHLKVADLQRALRF